MAEFISFDLIDHSCLRVTGFVPMDIKGKFQLMWLFHQNICSVWAKTLRKKLVFLN